MRNKGPQCSWIEHAATCGRHAHGLAALPPGAAIWQRFSRATAMATAVIKEEGEGALPLGVAVGAGLAGS